MSSEISANSDRGRCGSLKAMIFHVPRAVMMRREIVKERSPSVCRCGLLERTHHAHDVQGSILTQEFEGMLSRTAIQVVIDPGNKSLNASGLVRGEVELRRMMRQIHFIVFLRQGTRLQEVRPGTRRILSTASLPIQYTKNSVTTRSSSAGCML